MLYLSADAVPTDDKGQPLAFGIRTFYVEDTTTLTDVYDASDLSTALDNPQIADADGVFPDAWLDPSVRYGVKLEDQYGRLIYHVPWYRLIDSSDAFKYLEAQVRLVDGSGTPIPGGTISFSGGTVVSYADVDCTIAQTVPVVADAGGLLPAIYLINVAPVLTAVIVECT